MVFRPNEKSSEFIKQTRKEVDYNQRYSSYKEIIDKHLKKFFLKGEPNGLYEPIRYVLDAGGKRVRPIILLLSCESISGSYKEAINAALAIEIFHNFTLVHDDIMDNADLRRGLQTIHKKWDVNTAILSGDAMFAIAYKFLSLTKSPRINEIFDSFTQSAIEVCEGQALDLELETSFDVGVDDYIKMISKKTASLIKNSARIGGLIANGSEEQILALENYGFYLGLAFQLMDDLLDIIGDSEEFGKSIGGDIINGKRTFLLLTAMEKVQGKDKEVLEKVFLKAGVGPSVVDRVREIYVNYGIVDETHKVVRYYTSLAINSLQSIPESEARSMLVWLANKLCDRKI